MNSTKFSTLILVVLSILFLTCSGRHEQANKSSSNNTKSPTFKMVEIPVALQNDDDRALYFAMNFWENFDFSDTTIVQQSSLTEQAFVQFISVFDFIPMQNVQNAIDKTLAEASTKDKTGKMYAHFIELYHKYFYDPGSPIRNDEYYIPVATYLLQDSISDIAAKERAKFELNLMLKNRIDSPATDFKFVDAKGKTHSLYGVQAEYTMLYFYNADCHACKEVTAYINTSTVFNTWINLGRIHVVAVYPDADVDLWRKQLPTMPTHWLVGYDQNTTIYNQQLYDLKAIPTIYLLDKQKNVILKDVEVTHLEEYLNYLSNQ